MPKIQVVNIKCGGCTNTIKKSLESIGTSNIEIDIPSQTITFDGDEAYVTKTLESLGYPKANSEAAKSIFKRAVSYVSCAIGKIK